MTGYIYILYIILYTEEDNDNRNRQVLVPVDFPSCKSLGILCFKFTNTPRGRGGARFERWDTAP